MPALKYQINLRSCAVQSKLRSSLQTIYIFKIISEGVDVALPYDVAVKQWINVMSLKSTLARIGNVTDYVGIKNAFSY